MGSKNSFRYSFQKWADVKLSVVYFSSKENERPRGREPCRQNRVPKKLSWSGSVCASADEAGRQSEIRAETKTFIFLFQQTLLAKINEIDENKQILFFPKKNMWNKGIIFVKIFDDIRVLADFQQNICYRENMRRQEQMRTHSWRNWLFLQKFDLISRKRKEWGNIREFGNVWKNFAQITINITHCVRRVKAAEVMDEGRPSPLMISCHCFLLMTSTRPPLATTRLYSSYRSSTCLAMIGSRFIGVPRFCMKAKSSSRNSLRFGLSSISYSWKKNDDKFWS